LKDHPVKDYMRTPVATVDPEASLAEIRDNLVINKQRVLPVVEDGKVIGLISRTDLLHLLISENDEAQWSQPLRTKNILSMMRERLPKAIMTMLAQVGQVAAELGFQRLCGGRVCPGPAAQT
jgi:tRNA nucleotidyltransferase (CCA-adding enzyme)